MHISTKSVVDGLGKTDGLTSDEIKEKLAGIENSRSIFMPDDAKRAAKNTRELIDSEFSGDARAAVNFLKQHGNDPKVSSRDFNELIESGEAKKFIQDVKLAASNNGPAVAQNSTVAGPSGASQTGPSTAFQFKIPSLATPGFGGPMGGVGSPFKLPFDSQGRLDLNGDGVGGVPGLVKALLEGSAGMRTGTMNSSFLGGMTNLQNMGIGGAIGNAVGNAVGNVIKQEIKNILNGP